MRLAIVLALGIAACGPTPPAPREPQPPPPEPPLTPIPPPTDALAERLPWDLYVMYRNVTELAAAGTHDAARCDWNLQMTSSITALFDHGDPGTVPEDEWRAALAAIDESVGGLARACDEATDVEGRFGELRLDVEAGVRLVLATDSSTTP